MRNYLICLLAVIGLHAERVFGQALGGTVVRLSPTALPGICHVGDIRVDQANNFALSICTASGTWVVVSGSQPNPTTTLGDMIYNNGVGQARLPGNQSAFMTVLTQTGVGTASASPAWTNALTGMTISGVFSGPLTGTASFATLAGSVTSASQAGTASFAVLAGTASAATAFTATPTACGAGTFASAIGPNGNLTCSIVSTASTSGTAAFASVAGTASAATAFTTTPTACGANQYAGAIGPNGNLTCSTVTTASQAGTAAFVSSFSGLISPGQGGTGITTWTTNAIILGGNGTAAFSSVATGATSTYLKMTGGVPAWAALGNLVVTAVTTNYTAAAADDLIIENSSTTVTLPTAVGIVGKQFCIKRNTADVNSLTIATTSAQQIDSSASGTDDFSLEFKNEVLCVASDGANWSTRWHYYPNQQYTIAITNCTVGRSVAMFTRTKFNVWHMMLNLNCTWASSAQNTAVMTSITASSISRQSCSGNDNSGGSSPKNIFTEISGTGVVGGFSAATTNPIFSCNIELAGRPGLSL